MSQLKILLCAVIFTSLATYALAGPSQLRPQPAAPEFGGTCVDICIQQCVARGNSLPSCVLPCKAQCGI